jgi:hypothetical protein
VTLPFNSYFYTKKWRSCANLKLFRLSYTRHVKTLVITIYVMNFSSVWCYELLKCCKHSSRYHRKSYFPWIQWVTSLARQLISRQCDAFEAVMLIFFAVGLVTARLHVPLVGSCRWVATSRRKRIRIINQCTKIIASHDAASLGCTAYFA